MVRPGHGQTVTVAGDVYRLLGVGTDGSYFVMAATVPPRRRATGARARARGGSGMLMVDQQLATPPHVHAREEEGFYVLDGEIDFTPDDKTMRAGSGSYLNMPKATPHAFRNNTDRPARMLITCAPAGIERFFIDADGKPPEALAGIAARYGTTILP